MDGAPTDQKPDKAEDHGFGRGRNSGLEIGPSSPSNPCIAAGGELHEARDGTSVTKGSLLFAERMQARDNLLFFLALLPCQGIGIREQSCNSVGL